MGENSDVEPTILSNLTQSRMGNKNTKEHKGSEYQEQVQLSPAKKSRETLNESNG